MDLPKHEIGHLLLRARDLELRPGAAPIEFELRAGELVGVAGLEGQGQDEFLHALRGAGAWSGAVDVGPDPLRSPRTPLRKASPMCQGTVVLNQLFPSLSVRENFSLPTVSQDVGLAPSSLAPLNRAAA